MIVIWCIALTQIRLGHADAWDRPRGSMTAGDPERTDKLPFKLGCALVVVPLLTIAAAAFVMLILWISRTTTP